jgi:uncharacterized protein RhaS with RHS repeats
MADANDLVYLRARYYHPGLGVFTGLDPVEFVNRYQYVSSNPIDRIDPIGLVDCSNPSCPDIENEIKKRLWGWVDSGGKLIKGIFQRVIEMLDDDCCLFDIALGLVGQLL